jgi:hypothetical protein
MRTLLVLIFLAAATQIFGQNDFRELENKSREFFDKGDYSNLKKVTDKMIASGMDYYYLRLRLGILAYRSGHFPVAADNFSGALKYNSLDTISHEYIYYSYLLSGRKNDADLYLLSLHQGQKNSSLASITEPVITNVFAGASITGYDYLTYTKNKLYYEALKYCNSFNAGLEATYMNRFRGTFMFTNFKKTGTYYSAVDSTGKALDFSQNQLYMKLSGSIFPGWEISGFGHFAFYTEIVPAPRPFRMSSTVTQKGEYAVGLGLSKSYWKIRAGLNASISNFENSRQVRSEAYITYLPSGNLNLYFTTGGMLQNDSNWGRTYQANADFGLRLSKKIWFEAGLLKGNSFHYVRESGIIMNNSFLIPSTSVYCNFILMPLKKITVNISPSYTFNNSYSWNLSSLYRGYEVDPNSFGIVIKIIYNN